MFNDFPGLLIVLTVKYHILYSICSSTCLLCIAIVVLQVKLWGLFSCNFSQQCCRHYFVSNGKEFTFLFLFVSFYLLLYIGNTGCLYSYHITVEDDLTATVFFSFCSKIFTIHVLADNKNHYTKVLSLI